MYYIHMMRDEKEKLSVGGEKEKEREREREREREGEGGRKGGRENVQFAIRVKHSHFPVGNRSGATNIFYPH